MIAIACGGPRLVSGLHRAVGMGIGALLADLRGTSSAGILALSGTAAVLGAGYLGYHKHVTGNAVQNLVPEWQVASVDGDSLGLVDGPQLCAGASLPETGQCIVTATVGGAVISFEISHTLCTLDSIGDVRRAICTVPAGITGALGGAVGVFGGTIVCGGGFVGQVVVDVASAAGEGLQRLWNWASEAVAGAIFGYSQQDYEEAGIGAETAAALAAADRCSPQEFLRRARAVHGPRGVGGGLCDDDVLQTCEADLSCAENLAQFAALRECIKARSKRDYCFGGPDQHHDETINYQLSNRYRSCLIHTAATCDGERPRIQRVPEPRACVPGGGPIASEPSGDHTGAGPTLIQ